MKRSYKVLKAGNIPAPFKSKDKLIILLTRIWIGITILLFLLFLFGYFWSI